MEKNLRLDKVSVGLRSVLCVVYVLLGSVCEMSAKICFLYLYVYEPKF